MLVVLGSATLAVLVFTTLACVILFARATPRQPTITSPPSTIVGGPGWIRRWVSWRLLLVILVAAAILITILMLFLNRSTTSTTIPPAEVLPYNMAFVWESISDWWEVVEIPTWMIALVMIALLILARYLPKGYNLLAVILFVGILLHAASDGVDRMTDWLDRVINNGDWSERAGYTPKVIGGTLWVEPGEPKTVDIQGKIKVPIPVRHCLDVSPKDTFFINWDDSISNAYIIPRSGKMKRVTVTALPAEECGEAL